MKKTNNLDTFQWIGVSARGKKLEGELTSSSIALVKAQLRKQGITPSKVKRKPKPLFGIQSVQKIIPKDIALVTRQIATMLMA
ncbi:type II secretion system F family protein, partial [Cobetia sp. SIMBA_158]